MFLEFQQVPPPFPVAVLPEPLSKQLTEALGRAWLPLHQPQFLPSENTKFHFGAWGFYSDKSADNKDEFGHTDSKTRVHIMPLKTDFTQLGHVTPLPCPVFSNWCYVPVIPFYIWKPLEFLFLQTILDFLFSQEGLEEFLNIVFTWLQVCIMALERKLLPRVCGWWRLFRAHDAQRETPKNLFKAWL